MSNLISYTTRRCTKFTTLLVLLFVSMGLMFVPKFTFAQNTEIEIPSKLYKQANTAKNATYLSEDEKKVILYMNIARLDGKWFIKHILDKYDDNRSYYSKSLRRDLMKTSGLQAFKPSENLSKSAKYHAKDMGKTGRTGHNSSDGTDTFVRIKRFASGNYMSENCAYGYSEPIRIVIQLLIDEGISSLGHRKTILSKNYNYVGVSIEPHKSYRYNCVQDFSDRND